MPRVLQRSTATCELVPRDHSDSFITHLFDLKSLLVAFAACSWLGHLGLGWWRICHVDIRHIDVLGSGCWWGCGELVGGGRDDLLAGCEVVDEAECECGSR